jgi:phosphoribosyl-ATP pyrophosphohydrolase
MKINIYDENLNLVAPIGENYVSCLWAEGYNTVESFTLELVATETYKKKIKTDMYVKRVDRDNVMVIKSIQNQGNKLIVSGKQAVRVLDDVPFVGTIPEGSRIDTALVEAYNKTAEYKNVDFVESGLKDKYPNQISNKSVLEMALDMCQTQNIGIKAVKSVDRIAISLYKPDNTPIKFSEFIGNAKFDNIVESVENYKNYAIVLGEGEGEERVKVNVNLSNGGKWLRMIVDARDIQREENESDESYKKKLTARGVEKLLERTKAFSVDVINSPKGFGTEYDLGYNVLVVIPEYDLRYTTRVARFEEKSQQNKSEVSITLGELIKVR